ncbi:MAG: hypothetical protein OXN96_03990 [Bryobacterales bacterium]|nr:hypothetical protein [Bryobacterales bacterium]
MYGWIKKLHIYSGLLSYVGFTVWGIVGIWASFAPAPAERPRREPELRSIAFQVDGGATDQEITDAMIVASGLPFIQPGRKPNRDADGRLQVRYLTPNGTRRILLLERENLLRIERTPSPLGGFLNLMHMQTLWIHNPGWEVHLWGAYNQFSMWAVIFMTASGFYMWLATRPRMAWALWTLGLSAVLTVALYAALR